MRFGAIGFAGTVLAFTLAGPAFAVGVTPSGTSATFDVSGRWSITPPAGFDMGPAPIPIPGERPGELDFGQIDPPSLDEPFLDEPLLDGPLLGGPLLGGPLPGGLFFLEVLAASTWGITGSFVGEVQHFDPETVTPYAIGIEVSAALDGPEAPPPFRFSDTFVTDPISLASVKDIVTELVLAETTEEERQAAFDAVTAFIADAGDGDGAIATLPDGGGFFFAWSNFVTTANSASGDFEIAYEPAPPFVLLEQPASYLLDGEGPGSLSGTFSIGLSIAPAPVPLPAGLPLMGLALAGLWGLRRRR